LGRPLALLTLLLTLGGAGTAAPDTIVLTSGTVIQVEHAWYEGSELRYRQDGVLRSVPRDRVARVEAAPETALLDPDILRSRERLTAGDAPEALRCARLALFRDPGSLPALQALAAAQLALGDPERARQSAATAASLDPKSPLAHELLGDALSDLGEFAAARESYEAALHLAPGTRVQAKLDALGSEVSSVSSARFRIRYDGTADQPMGLAILRVLDAAWDDYAVRLGFTPDAPVTVVLQTATAFRDTTRAPQWVAAWNDGEIRVPVKGLDEPTPGLVRVLRHELAHSFVASRAGTNCPTWLHEGLAQWLEGGDPAREDAALTPVARAGRLLRLQSLERPFLNLDQAQATAVYAQSLSAVAHILRRTGVAGIRRLIAALAEGIPPAQALQKALALTYAEFQRDWEAHLRAGTRSVHGAGL
jgi:hypothetical protein